MWFFILSKYLILYNDWCNKALQKIPTKWLVDSILDIYYGVDDKNLCPEQIQSLKIFLF